MNNVDFEQLKQKVIPYFVEVYGKEFESLIVNRLNEVVPIFYSTVDRTNSYVQSLEGFKRHELVLNFLEHNNIVIPEELKIEAVEGPTANTYIFNQVPGVKELLDFCFHGSYNPGYSSDLEELSLIFTSTLNKSEYDINKSINKLKILGITVTKDNYDEWLMTDECRELKQKVDDMKSFILKMNEEYAQFDIQFADTKSIVEKKNFVVVPKIKEKYTIEFIKSLEDYMTEHDKEILHDYLEESGYKSFNSLTSQLNILKIVGENYEKEGLLHFFSEDSNQKLVDDSTSNYIKNTIIEGRIEYYKLIGVYDESVPNEEFINSSIAIQNIPKQTFIDDILSKKNHFKQLASDELLMASSNYRECMDKLESLGLIDLDPLKHCLDVIKIGTRCIDPSVRIENNIPMVVPILFYSQESCEYDFADVHFIHELNHAIELTLSEYDKDKIMVKTGFEYIETGIKERKYEQFSEIINQLIAIKVTEAMHKDGVYLFDDPTRAKLRGSTSYEAQTELVEDFLNKFKSDIILARVSNNLEPLFKVVGRENFERLNNSVNEYAMYNKLSKNKPWDQEIIAKKELVKNESKIIYDAMVAHANGIGLYEESKENVI